MATASPPFRPFPFRQILCLIGVSIALYCTLGGLLLAANRNAMVLRHQLMAADNILDAVRFETTQMHDLALLAAATGEQIFAVRYAQAQRNAASALKKLQAIDTIATTPVTDPQLAGRMRDVAAIQQQALADVARYERDDAWQRLRSLGYENAVQGLEDCLNRCDDAVEDRADAALASQNRETLAALWCVGIFTPAFACIGLALARKARRDANANLAAQNELAISERRFRDTFELAVAGIAHVALDGSLLHANARFAEILGFTREELVGVNIAAFTHPEDLKRDMVSMRRLLAGEIPSYSMDKRYVRKDGREVWAELTVSLARDAAGAPLYCISVILDVSLRIAAQAAARESALTLAALLDATTDRVFLADANGRLLSANAAAAKGLGCAPGDAVGLSFEMAFGPDLGASRLQRLHQALESGRIVRFTDERDGVVYDHVVAPLPPGPDGTTRAALFARDTTDLVRAREAAEAGNRAKSEFLANLGHEIRTPLNGILGMAQVLAGLDPTEVQRECLDDLSTASTTLLALIDNLLDLTMLESGHAERVDEPFVLVSVIEAVSDHAAPRAKGKGLTYAAQIEPNVPPLLVGDGDKLRQALRHLTDNAVKFTETGGVTLTVCCQDACPDEAHTAGSVVLRFTVADTGIGIAPEDAGRIFASFTQADGSATRRFGGAGLGLAITAGLVRLLGGKISLESTPGQGSAFSFSLPFAVS